MVVQNITFVHYPADADKVAGIKAIRLLSGISLKEGKKAVEDLMEGKEVTVPYRKDVESAKDGMRDFLESGAKTSKVDPIEELLREAMDLAMEQRKYPLVASLGNILNNTVFDRPYV